MYHRFPKNVSVQRSWISRCKREDNINVDSARICSDHFLADDYVRDLKNELLGLPVRKRLKPDAVPSQKIPNWHGDKTQKTVADPNNTGDKVLIHFLIVLNWH